MTDTHTERLNRARASLEGLSVADALGGFFEFSDKAAATAAANRRIPNATPWNWTDDTNMALSIYEILRRFEAIDQDALAVSYGLHYAHWRGYGMSMHTLLPPLGQGEDWRELNKRFFPDGSWGNGGPMKIAPVGAYYADDMAALVKAVDEVTVITHAHPESVAGSTAVAAAAAIAWNTRETAPPAPEAFIQQVIDHTPQSDVRQGLEKAKGLPASRPLKKIVEALGNGARISSMDSAPFAVWCAANHLTDYEDAVWTVIAAGGDVDTIGAMVGGIVACRVGMEGIPQAWRDAREPLPEWALG